MTTDETLLAILRRIIIEPDEDVHRLVFADRLDELGEASDLARAKFIRGSIENAGRGFECYQHPATYDVGFRPLPEEMGDRWVEFDRGFMCHWVTDADTFIRHADELIWHPTQTVKCKGGITHPHGEVCHYGCKQCDGSGFTPRPCPPTAQPVRKVLLTTIPDLVGEGVRPDRGYATYSLRNQSERKVVFVDESDTLAYDGSPGRVLAACRLFAHHFPGPHFSFPNVSSS